MNNNRPVSENRYTAGSCTAEAAAMLLLCCCVEFVGRSCRLELEYVHATQQRTVGTPALGALGMSGGCAAACTAVWMTPPP